MGLLSCDASNFSALVIRDFRSEVEANDTMQLARRCVGPNIRVKFDQAAGDSTLYWTQLTVCRKVHKTARVRVQTLLEKMTMFQYARQICRNGPSQTTA